MSVILEEPTALIQKEMNEDGKATGQDTERLQSEYLKKYMPELEAKKYPWRLIQDAIRHGYIYPGWNIM